MRMLTQEYTHPVTGPLDGPLKPKAGLRSAGQWPKTSDPHQVGFACRNGRNRPSRRAPSEVAFVPVRRLIGEGTYRQLN